MLTNNKESLPFQNPDLPIQDRVADLVSRFTLEEKIGLMPQYQTAVERLGGRTLKHGTEAAQDRDLDWIRRVHRFRDGGVTSMGDFCLQDDRRSADPLGLPMLDRGYQLESFPLYRLK